MTWLKSDGKMLFIVCMSVCVFVCACDRRTGDPGQVPPKGALAPDKVCVCVNVCMCVCVHVYCVCVCKSVRVSVLFIRQCWCKDLSANLKACAL